MTVSIAKSTTAVTTPSTLLIPEGATSAEFSVRGADITAQATCDITVTSGAFSLKKTTTVKPCIVTSFTLNPTTIAAGQESTATVTLPAEVTVSTYVDVTFSVEGVATAPARVKIAAGASSATFKVTGAAVTLTSKTNVIVSRAGASKYVRLTVTP